MEIISGLYKGQRLLSPKSSFIRPTSSKLRASLFNICQNYIENSLFLDLFAGAGTIGLEALSRGAKEVTFIDSNKQAIDCILKNIEKLNLKTQTHVYLQSVQQALENLSKQKKKFDIIFADPPYAETFLFQDKLISYSNYVILTVEKLELLSIGGCLFIEEDSRRPPSVKTEHLYLKNSRQFGDSLLQTYCLQE